MARLGDASLHEILLLPASFFRADGMGGVHVTAQWSLEPLPQHVVETFEGLPDDGKLNGQRGQHAAVLAALPGVEKSNAPFSCQGFFGVVNAPRTSRFFGAAGR